MQESDNQLLQKIETAINKEFKNPFGRPTDIIGFGAVGRKIAESLAPLVGRKEICFFDEKIKFDSAFHYLDFEKMFEKTEIMIFTTELPEKYFKNIKQINKKVKIFVPKEFESTIRTLRIFGLEQRIIVI